MARGWNLLSGLLLVLVASNVFSAVEQGVFYTFLSLGAAQYFFDLGVGFVLANLAGLNTPEDQEGQAYNKKELALVRVLVWFGLKWSAIAGLALVVILGISGILIFSTQAKSAANVQIVWLFYVILVACAMGFFLFLRLFEGLGFVVEAAIARSIQSFVNIVVLYLLAMAGFGIASMAVALLVALIAASSYFFFSSEKIRQAFSAKISSEWQIDWHRDIWPFQSRMAVSWIASYIIFQAQVPLLYMLASPVEAGRFGITIQIFQALNTSANIFLTYNVRHWTRLSANNELKKLDRSFLNVLFLTTGLMAIGCMVVLFGFWLIDQMGLVMAERFPNRELMFLYAIAATSNQIFFSLGYYFRASGTEPLWWISTLAATMILLVPLVLGTSYDIVVASWSFFATSIFILGILAVVYSYFLSTRRKRQS